jgi:hypothetical protein
VAGEAGHPVQVQSRGEDAHRAGGLSAQHQGESADSLQPCPYRTCGAACDSNLRLEHDKGESLPLSLIEELAYALEANERKVGHCICTFIAYKFGSPGG